MAVFVISRYFLVADFLIFDYKPYFCYGCCNTVKSRSTDASHQETKLFFV